MSPRMPTPVEVGGVVEPVLRIIWSDGHHSIYHWRSLRLHCPCAACKGEWTVRRHLDPASIPAGIRALRLDRVGAYALRPSWSDGHSTGIYTFTYLRGELCECEECAARHGTAADASTGRTPG